ncbi:MAG: radical SAM protein [Hadesarchaea archaeon]|nr:radical SAM protein [Hadesarchaea archaeon]
MDREEIMDKNFLDPLSVKTSRSEFLWVSKPHPKYPTISITENHCDLNCAHCDGQYLKGMMTVNEPEKLLSVCKDLESEGAKGVLLSGGYNERGYVPFKPFIDSIRRVKKETDLFVSIHPGLMPEGLIKELGNVGVDEANFDLIGSNDTIDLVLGIDKSIKDYQTVLKTLDKEISNVVPHICIGLHKGDLRGERRALEIVSEINPSVLVFLILNPTTGTEFESLDPPTPHEVGELIAEARLKFPQLPLSLGCMRPRGVNRTDFEAQAIKAGVDRIELPTSETLELAREFGLKTRTLEACCGVPEEELVGGRFG